MGNGGFTEFRELKIRFGRWQDASQEKVRKKPWPVLGREPALPPLQPHYSIRQLSVTMTKCLRAHRVKGLVGLMVSEFSALGSVASGPMVRQSIMAGPCGSQAAHSTGTGGREREEGTGTGQSPPRPAGPLPSTRSQLLSFYHSPVAHQPRTINGFTQG